MSRRAETGPLRFGDDWPGVFIRGDNAAHYAHALDVVLAYLDKQPVGDGELSPIMVEVVRGLQSDLLSCDIAKRPAVQACHVFERCVESDWGAKLSEDGLEMVIAGTCVCGFRHKTKEKVECVDYYQSYTFACSCGRNVSITAKQLNDAMAEPAPVL